MTSGVLLAHFQQAKTLTLRNPDGTPRWKQATADDPDGCGVSHAPVSTDRGRLNASLRTRKATSTTGVFGALIRTS
jgi:hypothetical protein